MLYRLSVAVKEKPVYTDEWKSFMFKDPKIALGFLNMKQLFGEYRRCRLAVFSNGSSDLCVGADLWKGNSIASMDDPGIERLLGKSESIIGADRGLVESLVQDLILNAGTENATTQRDDGVMCALYNRDEEFVMQNSITGMLWHCSDAVWMCNQSAYGSLDLIIKADGSYPTIIHLVQDNKFCSRDELDKNCLGSNTAADVSHLVSTVADWMYKHTDVDFSAYGKFMCCNVPYQICAVWQDGMPRVFDGIGLLKCRKDMHRVMKHGTGNAWLNIGGPEMRNFIIRKDGDLYTTDDVDRYCNEVCSAFDDDGKEDLRNALIKALVVKR